MQTYEKTFVLIKPDALKRNLVGRIIQFFEDANLDILDAKMVETNKKIATKHYTQSNPEEWSLGVGEKTKSAYKHYNTDPKDVFGTADALTIGNTIRQWSIDYLSHGKALALILGGSHAIESTKMIIGPTEPFKSSLDTIRGMFGTESYVHANLQGRSVHNIVHRSTNEQEAVNEIKVWFVR